MTAECVHIPAVKAEQRAPFTAFFQVRELAGFYVPRDGKEHKILGSYSFGFPDDKGLVVIGF